MQQGILENMRAWLQTAPGFERVKTLYLDYADLPGTAGLWPTGVQEVSRQYNVLGAAKARCRCTFVLRLLLPFAPGADDTAAENARFVLALQQWMAAQSAQGLAPKFGAEPGERLWGSGGKMEAAEDEGYAKYTITITAEYTTKMEETDEN